MQTSFANKFGACVFHSPIPTFDVTNPSSLRLPTRTKILCLPLECLQMAHIVVIEFGTMSESDPNNPMLVVLDFVCLSM
jgi:hypothetical protein